MQITTKHENDRNGEINNNVVKNDTVQSECDVKINGQVPMSSSDKYKDLKDACRYFDEQYPIGGQKQNGQYSARFSFALKGFSTLVVIVGMWTFIKKNINEAPVEI